MDVATIIGLTLGVCLVIGSIAIGGSLLPFVNIPSIMIVVGGSFSALLINFPVRRVFGVFAVVKNCFVAKLPDKNYVIGQFTELARTARRDGLLALEQQLDQVSDPFLKRGLEMVVAGSSREELSNVLTTEITCIEERHELGKKVLDSLGVAAPAFGMIGTLIGLVQMLRTLDDPSQIGSGMATALLTTLYGAVIANLFCIPLAGKLEARSREEMAIRELMVSGLAGLVDGLTPRSLQERMAAYVADSQKAEILSQAV